MVIVHPQWVLFGDSITQHSWMLGGLGQHLSEAYQRRMDIVNRGYGGYNTTCGLEVAPHILPRTDSKRPLRALSLWWGANDATLPIRTQSVTRQVFKENLRKMIAMVQQPQSPYYHPGTRIIVFSCPPVCIEQRREDVKRRFGPGIELDRTAERTRDFAVAAGEVAEEMRVGFVNVYDKMMEAAGPKPEKGLRKLLSDGLHLTAAGYEVVAAALFEYLKAECPDLLPDNVPRLFPDWSEIDPQDPGKAFPKP